MFVLPVSEGSDDARRLYYDLLTGRKYNKLIRPVGNSSQKLNVKMGIRLSQLIDIVSTLILCVVYLMFQVTSNNVMIH